MRRILHIDMDAFLEAVEQKRHPEFVSKLILRFPEAIFLPVDYEEYLKIGKLSEG